MQVTNEMKPCGVKNLSSTKSNSSFWFFLTSQAWTCTTRQNSARLQPYLWVYLKKRWDLAVWNALQFIIHHFIFTFFFFIYIEMPFYIYDIQCKVSYADKHIRPWIFCLVKVNGDEEIFFLVHNLVDTMDMEIRGIRRREVRRWRELVTSQFAQQSKGTSKMRSRTRELTNIPCRLSKKKKKIPCYPMAHLMSSGCRLFILFKNKIK